MTALVGLVMRTIFTRWHHGTRVRPRRFNLCEGPFREDLCFGHGGVDSANPGGDSALCVHRCLYPPTVYTSPKEPKTVQIGRRNWGSHHVAVVNKHQLIDDQVNLQVEGPLHRVSLCRHVLGGGSAARRR